MLKGGDHPEIETVQVVRSIGGRTIDSLNPTGLWLNEGAPLVVPQAMVYTFQQIHPNRVLSTRAPKAHKPQKNSFAESLKFWYTENASISGKGSAKSAD